MGSANNLNISSTGVTGFTGTTFSGSSTTQNAILIGGATTNTISNVGPLTNGQVLIGSTSAAPVAASLTQGYKITVTPGAGSIAIAADFFPWTEITTTDQTTAINNGYVMNNSYPLRANLPSSAAVGSEIKFSNKGTGGFLVAPAAGETVNLLTTSATAPNALSTSSICAALDIICTTQDTVWNTVNHEGTFAVQAFPYQASSGDTFVSYLRVDGTVWEFGSNAYGQLGNNTTTSYSSPISVVGNHAFISIYAADSSLLAIKSNGSAWAWGNNNNGQLGNNTTISYSSPISVVGNHSFIQISGGNLDFYGLKADGSAWAWGENTIGQLGNNTTTNYASPISVVGNHSFTQISGGYRASYGLKADGSAWTWGNNDNGQLGNNTTTSYSSPISVVGNHSFIQISGGLLVSYALKADGSAWAWGRNIYGELGNNTTISYSSPISVVGNHSFVRIASASLGDYACGLKADGSVWSWGYNGSGQLGNKTTINYSSPISVVGNHSFVALAQHVGAFNISAWKQNGQLWAWGNGTFGQLGNNTGTNYSSPILVLNTP